MDGRNISATARTLGYLLRLPYERLSEQVYGALAAEGFPEVRPAHSAVFRHIAASGSRVSDLAEQAGLTKQSMAYLVETLASAGYLSIAPDPSDGRAKLVRLTRRGQAVSATLVRLSRDAEREFAARLAPGQMASLRSLLGELAEVLERR
jgi:DNA-binding MarR family transcriptional regulator